MKLIINGVEGEHQPSTLAQVVAGITSAHSGIAVAVNDLIVPRHQWDSTQLSEGSRIEIVTAVQGG